jgi:hypothetical protein
LNITTILTHEQPISCELTADQAQLKWVQTFVYEATKGLERKSLWQYLLLIKNQIGDVPWLLLGNFNVVQSVQEKWIRVD